MKPFIDDWSSLYKRFSIWFAIMAGLVLQQLASNPQPALDFIQSIHPDWVRRALVLLVSTGVPIMLSAVKQPKVLK